MERRIMYKPFVTVSVGEQCAYRANNYISPEKCKILVLNFFTEVCALNAK